MNKRQKKIKATTTSTSRVAALRQRRAEQGLGEVRGAWAHPDDHALIKQYAARLSAKRGLV